MAAQEIGALRALLTATSVVFEKDMKAAKDSVHRHGTSMQKTMASVGKRFNEAATAFNKYAGVVAVGAATSFAYFIKKQIDAADAIGKMAQQTGTSTEFLSAMGYVAEQSGTSLDNIAKSTQKLAKNMDDFRRGTGEARYAFEDLGIKVADANGVLRNSEDVLLDIADKFSKLEDGAEKTTMAVRLFGRSGAELLPMLNLGRAGIEQLTDKAREMGLVIGAETAAQAAYLNDQMNTLKNEMVGVGRSIAVSFLPDLIEAVKTIRFAYEESGLLTAAWVALGAAGHAAFSTSIDTKIKQTSKLLQEETEKVERYQQKVNEAANRDWNKGSWLGGIWNKGADEQAAITLENSKRRVAEYRAELAALEQQKSQEAANEKSRIEAAIQKAQQEADAKRRAIEAIREQAEARAAAGAEAARLRAEDEARIRAEESATRAIESQIQALEIQRDTFNMTTREATLYKISLMDGVTPAQLETAAAILTTIDALEAERDAVGELSKATAGLAVSGKEQFAELTRAIDGWGKESSRAIADFAIDGANSFSDLAKSIIKDIIQMIVYQQMAQPIFNAIGGAAAGMFSSGASASINSGTDYTFGGISVNQPIPRASGGPTSPFETYLVGEQGPELLQMGGRGGYVHPSLSGSSVAVENNITIQGGNPKVSEQENGTGGKDIVIMIDEAMGGMVGAGRGKLFKSIRQTFGASPTLAGR